MRVAAFPSRALQDHAPGIVIRLGCRNIGVCQNKAGHGARLGQAEGVVLGPALNILGLPVKGPVAIHVIPAHTVFIDAPVLVIVNALLAEQAVLA